MGNIKIAYCSWCLRKTTHQLNGDLVNSTYFCKRCKKPTKSCIAPNCYEQSRNLDFIPKGFTIKEFSKPFDYYSNLYCAQHSGIIPSFESLYQKIDNLDDYEIFKTSSKHNLKKYTDRTLFLIVIAATGISILPEELISDLELTDNEQVSELTSDEAISANPAIDEDTINSIQLDKTVQNALLSSATIGFLLTNPNFKLIHQNKEEAKSSRSIIFINGFLTKGILDFEKWDSGFYDYIDGFKKYSLEWDSKSISPNKFIFIAKKLNKATLAAEIIAKWVGAKNNCIMTARGFASIMSRTRHTDYVDLAGHSLGCQFIQSVLDQYTLLGPTPIRNIYLFGGAVDNDKHIWEKQINMIHGKVYNFYSDNDEILKKAYQTTTFFSGTPIGLGEIQVTSDKIKNINVSHIINGHNEYKTKLKDCLNYANTIYPVSEGWYERKKLNFLMKLHLKRCFKKKIKDYG